MKRSIGVAVVVCVLALAAPALTGTAAAAPQHATRQKVDTGPATDFSSQRYHNRYFHYNGYDPFGYRRHYRGYHRPYYYARPYYYRPYPYDALAPFTFGFGFGPY